MDGWGAVALLAGAAAYGAVAGLGVRRWLRRGAYRVYDDEHDAPLPRHAWPPPVLAVVAALLAWRLGDYPLALVGAYVLVLPLYAALAGVDADVHRLPDVLTLPAYPVVGALLALATVPGGDWGAYGRACLAGVALTVAFVILQVTSRDRLGWGDVKLAGPLGMLLGWFGWGTLVVGVYGMFLVGGLAAAALLVARRARLRSAFAFGPAMILGTLLGVLVDVSGLVAAVT